VYNQGRTLGAARFRRLEGSWFGNGAVYFNATNGCDSGFGQVWEFRPEGDGGKPDADLRIERRAGTRSGQSHGLPQGATGGLWGDARYNPLHVVPA
jgi:secreted PhoX family phosphatase